MDRELDLLTTEEKLRAVTQQSASKENDLNIKELRVDN